MPGCSSVEDPIESFSVAELDATHETPMDQDGKIAKPDCECGVQVRRLLSDTSLVSRRGLGR